ncbi:DUF4336-containing protein [Aureococcus anophagefferens]|nr:DUF4336-containing protein [Aureococcus anophagefferens]
MSQRGALAGVLLALLSPVLQSFTAPGVASAPSRRRAVARGAAEVDDGGDGAFDRRTALVGGALLAGSAVASAENPQRPSEYGLWGVLPVPSRMVVVKLSEKSGGGLFVYNPIAATRELVSMVRDLEKQHGPVRHVVLGTVAIEHKTYCGVFASKFPKATVWVQPGQYAVPVNLPNPLLGFPSADEGAAGPVDKNNVDELRRSWRRVQLFGLYFMRPIAVHSVNQAVEAAAGREPGLRGYLPWDWVGDDGRAFAALRGSAEGRAARGPILQALILNRNPVETLDWADAVATWDFKRVIPAHLKNDVAADGAAFRQRVRLPRGGEAPGSKPRDDDPRRPGRRGEPRHGRHLAVPGKPKNGEPRRAHRERRAAARLRPRAGAEKGVALVTGSPAPAR